MNQSIPIDTEGLFHHFSDEVKKPNAEWPVVSRHVSKSGLLLISQQETESQAHIADQIYWQDISQCSSLDSPIIGHMALSWSSPNHSLNDGSDSNFDRQDSGCSLEGISEVLSAGCSCSYVVIRVLTTSSVAELKIEHHSEPIANDGNATSKASRKNWKLLIANMKNCPRNMHSYASST